MRIVDLILQAQRLGIRLEARGDTLNVQGPKHALTPELRAALAARKLDIIRAVTNIKLTKVHVIVFTLEGPAEDVSWGGPRVGHPIDCESKAEADQYRLVQTPAVRWDVS